MQWMCIITDFGKPNPCPQHRTVPHLRVHRRLSEIVHPVCRQRRAPFGKRLVSSSILQHADLNTRDDVLSNTRSAESDNNNLILFKIVHAREINTGKRKQGAAAGSSHKLVSIMQRMCKITDCGKPNLVPGTERFRVHRRLSEIVSERIEIELFSSNFFLFRDFLSTMSDN
ncbi:hypothetical protein CEXT_746931 [Caerostris extrusa]|uniref:Uncharacterized protein n=1 Tax=Caerostris extrusa TaxID=172846 RepID=A0AAV4QMK3_CAEEX|nr:hypothetical protein CEXT_746931 [Caerostris extrusa]